MIRLAEPDDEPAITECAARAYARYVPLIGRAPAPMVANFKAQIAAREVYAAFGPEGAFQGFIVFAPKDDCMMLENVAVLPAAAGQGVGKALIGFCEDAARRLGCRGVRLYTNAAMTGNLALYPRLGYAQIDRRREDGFDRVFFEKTLG